MRDEKAGWGLLLGSVLLQWYIMYASDLYETALPFATGLLSADTGGRKRDPGSVCHDTGSLSAVGLFRQG